MKNTAESISNLLQNKSQSASQMTHALKEIGDGKMQQAFSKISKIKIAEGRVQGTVVTITAIAIIGSIGKVVRNVVRKKKENDLHKEEEGVVAQAVEEVASKGVQEEESSCGE